MAARRGQRNELGGRLAGTRDDDFLASLGRSTSFDKSVFA